MQSAADDEQLPNSRGPCVVVIGYGNTLRGDDALGPMTAELVAQRTNPADVEVRICQTLTPDLAERMASASLVIFLDVFWEGVPGEVVGQTLNATSDFHQSGGHQTTPQLLLNLALQLYGRVPDARLFGTRGESFQLADCQLTPAVQATLEPMVEQVCELIREHLLSFVGKTFSLSLIVRNA